MAITQVTIAGPAGLIEYTNDDIAEVKDAVKASSAVVYSIYIDNSANAAAASYLKIWNVASGSVTVGTTAPDEIIYVPAAARITVPMFTVAAGGKTFGTALTIACVTTAGTAGTTGPTSNVLVSILLV